MHKTWPVSIMALLIALIAFNSNAYADPSQRGTPAVPIAKTIHAAAVAVSLSDEFNGVMAEYDSEVLAERKEALLKKAKNILNQLIEQANNVESEISILSKKKLDKVYVKKLDRVLSNILQRKTAAQERMQAAGQSS